MTIITLLTYIGIAALLLTLLMYTVFQVKKSWFMSYLQNFTGILFLFSGWVKAVDPMGTAIKMEDYFAEFHITFADTALGFIAPIFPYLSNHSLIFAVFMIIFEIILGIMLILGDRPKLTAWLFFLLVIFFTILTGFTYMTGYVPMDHNFFEFGSWESYKASNMKVTDCGCFGDFILLEPKISFFKDLFLMLPAIYFLFFYKKMHQLFNSKIRNVILFSSTIFLLFYCVYNFYWNEPHVDFRPFKNGTNVAAIKKSEMDAAAAVKVVAYQMKNKKTGEIIEMKSEDYMKNFNQLKDEYEVVEQIKTEPSIKESKISHFDITDFEGNDVTDEYLANPKPHLMILVYKPEYQAVKQTKIIKDSIFKVDTIPVVGIKDSVTLVKTLVSANDKEVDYYQINWDKEFLESFEKSIVPLVKAAQADKVQVSLVISGIDAEKAASLHEATGLNVDTNTADEKLLKTIMRSNPGVVLWQNGVLLHKWHYKKLPDYMEIKTNYIK